MRNLVNLDEIFAMAVQIEDNGAAFYRRAAELHSSKEDVAFLNDLAAMEDGHKQLFTEMRKNLPDDARGRPEDLQPEGGMYLGAIADGYQVEGSPKATEALTGEETIADIARTGVDLEKQAVLFYMELKKYVPDDGAKQKIDTIIGEEKKHVVTLMEVLAKAS